MNLVVTESSNVKERGFWGRLFFCFWLTGWLFQPGYVMAQTGTVPPFRILAALVQNEAINFNINSATGCVYTLQRSDGAQGYWEDLASQAGTGGVLAFTDTFSFISTFHCFRIAGVSAASLNLFPSGPLLGSGAVSLPDAVVLSPYSLDISPVSTGTGPYAIALSGMLPEGISATVFSNHTDGARLQLSSAGTQLTAGQRMQFTVNVSDASGTNYSRIYDLRVVDDLPQILTSQVTLKTGAAANVGLLQTNGTAPFTWSLIAGPLPDGVTFTNGILSGTPTANASERNETGLYTNLLQISDSFTDRVTGRLRARSSCASVTTLVRLSYELNIVAGRPDGPVLGGICLGCHGPGFPPDFGSGTALSLINVSAGSGGQCSSSFVYVTPGDLGGSLLYWKVTNPICGEMMPLGGPYLNSIQTGRIARWITELLAGDTD